VVEEWLSGWPISPKRTFPQVSGMLSCASRLPDVKPSAKPTQVRTLDLPPEIRRSDPVRWAASCMWWERSGQPSAEPGRSFCVQI
jgi:hypothetical protein